MEQVAARKVGESGTYYFRQAVWSALMISSAIKHDDDIGREWSVFVTYVQEEVFKIL